MNTEVLRWLGQPNADNLLFSLLNMVENKEQFRSVWTTYCIMCDLQPNTEAYERRIDEVYSCYWCYSDDRDSCVEYLSEYLF